MDDKYKIEIMFNKINIYNYYKIDKINSDEIIVKFKKNVVKIYGENLLIIKLDECDMSISGKLIQLIYIYE